MLGFRICYLRGVVTAADVATGQEKDRVEWPPHPDRFFCALTQAWGDLGRPADGAGALRELERAGPPWIQCGRILRADCRMRYVPVNDNYDPVVKKKLAQAIQGTSLGRDRKGRRFPQAAPDDPEVYIYWPDLRISEENRRALRRLARQISHLGHSSSLVTAELVTEFPSRRPVWRPSPEGRFALRVPFPGRFDELVAAFECRKEMASWPPAAISVNYIEEQQQVQSGAGVHGELIPYRLRRDGPALPLEAAIGLMSVWRKALLAAAPQPVDEILSGHSSESTKEHPAPSARPHLALIPLADVGQPFAAGHLLGAAAVLPRATEPKQRQLCLNVLEKVRHINLGQLGQVFLEPVNVFERRKALLPTTWTEAAERWASVTPVVLGKYPKELFSDESCRIIEEACEIAGLPRPVSIEVGPMPWVTGSLPAARFPAYPSRPGKPRRAHLHVRLVFDRPIEGPVLVGAGRYLGYGLFRQV